MYNTDVITCYYFDLQQFSGIDIKGKNLDVINEANSHKSSSWDNKISIPLIFNCQCY